MELSRSNLSIGLVSAPSGAALATLLLKSGSTGMSVPPTKDEDAGVALVPPLEIEEEVWSRNRSFFGDEGFDAIRGTFVVVVGLGGVGSHAAHMLARSGVGAMRVIDFDQVSLSSLNRHAVASLRDVGRPKSEVRCDNHGHCTNL